ncbi:MAG: glucokinase [Micavibrio sp.]
MGTAPGLIADIGATNARFALADAKGFYEQRVLQCADFPTIVDAAGAYLDGLKGAAPKRGAFAIAGPVTGDYFEMTNHAWKFSVSETEKSLGMSHFTLMNDFKAIALAIPHLDKGDLKQIGGDQSAEKAGTIAIVGPGTGLGVASLFWDGQQYRANPGEGGHVTMAAKTQREFDIFRTLRYKYRHVSAERVCSGKGLLNIYNAIRILDGHEELPDRTPEQIAEGALAKSCPACVEALDKMMGFLGSIAGDLAMTLGASGGVYIAGGIPEKLGDYFFTSRFREEFEAKGRFDQYLKPIPTYLITHPFTAFVGLQHIVADGARG